VATLTQSGSASVNVGQDAGLLDLQLHVSKATNQSIDINWGDGTSYTSTSDTPGAPQSYSTDITHTYSGSLQDQTATLNISATGTGSPVGFQVPSASFTPVASTSIPITSAGATLALTHYDLSSTGLGLSGIGQMTGSAATAAVDAALSSVSQASTYFGDQQSTIAGLVAANTRRSDALQTAIGNMTDADMATEAAKATALSTKQALAVQALNIGNAQSGLLLRLFR
jgi:flagellin-like hook-associated protein FlgL